MAFGTPVARGTANGGTTADTSIAVAPTATIAAGRLCIVTVTKNNDALADGQTSEITSVTDSGSNTYTKAREQAEAGAGAAEGALVAVFYSVLGTQLTTGSTVTANIATAVNSGNSNAGRTISLTEVSIGTASVELAAHEGQSQGSTGISVALSGLASKEYLLIAAFAQEGGTNITFTEDSDYTQVHSFDTGGTTSVFMRQHMARRVATVTGDTYAVTLSASRDTAAVLVAFNEPAVAGAKPKHLLSLGIG